MVAELVAFLDGRAVDCAEAHDLVTDEAVRNQRGFFMIQEFEVVGLEVELGLFAHDDTLLFGWNIRITVEAQFTHLRMW